MFLNSVPRCMVVAVNVSFKDLIESEPNKLRTSRMTTKSVVFVLVMDVSTFAQYIYYRNFYAIMSLQEQEIF